MKKVYIATALAGAFTAPNLFASFGNGSITLNETSPATFGHANGGGEFNAVTTGAGLGNFVTFCVEYTEHISLGATYSYVINSGAVKGGYSTVPGGTSTFDPISVGTAWLYSNYRAGLYTRNDATMNNLQAAIWYLEGESNLVPDGSGNSLSGTGTPFSYTQTAVNSNPFLKGTGSVSAMFGTLADAAAAATPGAYGVGILNLYAYNHAGETGSIMQDQLAMVPEPTTMIAGALLLLPFGASTIRFLRKNRTA
jgi:hypothetical protein